MKSNINEKYLFPKNMVELADMLVHQFECAGATNNTRQANTRKRKC